jgi:hypothetical protein
VVGVRRLLAPVLRIVSRVRSSNAAAAKLTYSGMPCRACSSASTVPAIGASGLWAPGGRSSPMIASVPSTTGRPAARSVGGTTRLALETLADEPDAVGSVRRRFAFLLSETSVCARTKQPSARRTDWRLMGFFKNRQPFGVPSFSSHRPVRRVQQAMPWRTPPVYRQASTSSCREPIPLAMRGALRLFPLRCR